MKDKGSTKGKDEEVNLARQYSDDSDDILVMVAVADDHVESKSGSSTQVARIT